MVDLIGPASENAVTVRPARVVTRGDADTWFRDCSGPTAEDGTRLGADFFNDVLAQIRRGVRGMGISESVYSDDFLLDAIKAAMVRHATATGTANALVAAVLPPPTTYYAGLIVSIKAPLSPTGPATINLNGLGTKAIVRRDGSDVANGEWPANAVLLLIYDGAAFQLFGGGGGSGGSKGLKTGDLVLSFGSSARTDALPLIGSTYSRSLYADLWTWVQANAPLVDDSVWLNAANNRWGSFSRGDGVTSFRMPDLRGEFLRMFDAGRGIDSSRTHGVWQADDFKSHVHPGPSGYSFLITNPVPYEAANGGDHNLYRAETSTGATGGVETRPRNITVVPYIVY